MEGGDGAAAAKALTVKQRKELRAWQQMQKQQQPKQQQKKGAKQGE